MTITTVFRVDMSKAKVLLSRSEKSSCSTVKELASAISLQQLYIYGWLRMAYAEIKHKTSGYLGNERDMEGGLNQGRHSVRA